MIIVLVVHETEVREFLYSVYEKYQRDILHAIIFGSFSRGDFTPESDIDLLVVGKSRKLKYLIEDDLGILYMRYCVPTNLIFLTEDQFSTVKDFQFFQSVIERGVPIGSSFTKGN